MTGDSGVKGGRNQGDSKKVKRKKEKKKKLIDVLSESNINAVVEEHYSSVNEHLVGWW